MVGEALDFGLSPRSGRRTSSRANRSKHGLGATTLARAASGRPRTGAGRPKAEPAFYVLENCLTMPAAPWSCARLGRTVSERASRQLDTCSAPQTDKQYQSTGVSR